MNPTHDPQHELRDWLAPQTPALRAALLAIAEACLGIADAVAVAPLAGLHGATDGVNRHGEVQQKLDLEADQRMASVLAACPQVAAWASEERDEPTPSAEHAETGQVLVVYDPLDGSSNIDANLSIGTIFSVLPHPFHGTTPGAAGFLQPGRRQLAAGYAIYGPAAMLVLSCGQGVAMFTYDRHAAGGGAWRLTRREVQVPPGTNEFAINASNQRHWEKPVQRYIAECMAGEEGPRGRNFNMRWNASLVAEVHRILTRGGVFLYPRDNRTPYKPGRLRLLYEAAPMAFLMQQAGGGAVTGTQELLEVAADTLHQQVPVILGSRDEIERIVRYHADPHENVTWQLFKTRSLFVKA